MPVDQDYEYGPADDYFSADQLERLGVIWPDDLSKAERDVLEECARQNSQPTSVERIGGLAPARAQDAIRGDLVKVAALVIAEIERLDRIAMEGK